MQANSICFWCTKTQHRKYAASAKDLGIKSLNTLC